ncbi:M48 family metalloprotease [Marinobacter daepoensis]|uniref:Pilin n=1 Tax=Marinobacter daepoensis TaxID=262077 RepID=A0ABS3BBJ3_9GAMM|nr:M48 family metalloprotease [Marinobacter daepoensis]MBN7769224.1 M48 family metalloprotease [Marinobacter daepoensis]MBY6077914.1 M48 family metalloprotease [Marinobacter daepoensis]
MKLVYKNEKPLFLITAVLALLIWLALVVGTLGIVLIYLLAAYVFFLFAHSAFISHLKGSGVRITQEQYPDLHERLLRCCDRVGVREVPEAYLLRTDFFNALATKFLGRHFVVLFTDVVDALEDQPGAIDFYIGHELGHVHRKHLSWGPVLAPAAWLPLLGPALRRAGEYTCDRYGVACCQSPEDIKAALAAIAAGDTRWATINVDAFVGQVAATRGFWMSFNELTADYPWLTKRMATAMALSEGREVSHPGRSKLAWFLALFVPRLGVGGGAASLIIVVALVGVLAAVAVPQYQEYTERVRYQGAYLEAMEVTSSVEVFVDEYQAWPGSMEDLGYGPGVLEDESEGYSIDVYDGGVIGVEMGVDESGESEYIVLEPEVTESGLVWACYGQNVTNDYLPSGCR